MKKYLQTGMRITTNIVARVGVSGTVVDLVIDLSASEEFIGHKENGDSIDSIGYVDMMGRRSCDTFDVKLEFPVYVEHDSGKLWYDDDEGQ